MEPILFASDSLKFFFEKDSAKLVIFNRSVLPRSEKFLTKIYSLYPPPKTKYLPSRFSMRNKETVLLLNLENSIFRFYLEEIKVVKNWSIDFITSYNKKLYFNLTDLTDYYLSWNDGEVRISPFSTGALLVFENEEKEDLIDISIGMLNVLSPKDISDLM